MRKMYSRPEVDCSPIKARDLMQSMNGSVNGGGDQNGFNAPKRSGVEINE